MTDILTTVPSEILTRLLVRLIAYTDIILVVIVGVICYILERHKRVDTGDTARDRRRSREERHKRER